MHALLRTLSQRLDSRLTENSLGITNLAQEEGSEESSSIQQGLTSKQEYRAYMKAMISIYNNDHVSNIHIGEAHR